jgi:hypothetical protein
MYLGWIHLAVGSWIVVAELCLRIANFSNEGITRWKTLLPVLLTHPPTTRYCQAFYREMVRGGLHILWLYPRRRGSTASNVTAKWTSWVQPEEASTLLVYTGQILVLGWSQTAQPTAVMAEAKKLESLQWRRGAVLGLR